MSGVDSGFWIAVIAIVVASVWTLLILRPWKHPQHAARYRPDPVEVAALTETAPWPTAAEFTSYAQVSGHPPWDLEEEASARAAHGELVFGMAGGMGCDSGAMAAVDDDAGREAVLRDELAKANAVPVANRIIDVLNSLPGEDGPVVPPSGPAGAGCEPEGSGLTAPPAPVPWLERELGYLDDWARRMRAEWEL